MLVRKRDLNSVLDRFSISGEFGLDTETTGLTEVDRIFSLILSDAEGGVYFNFQPYEGLDDELVLPRTVFRDLNERVFSNPESRFFLANAKFDLRMLAKERCQVRGEVHDILSMERVLKNNHPKGSYDLEGCAERRGMKKDDAVDAYVKKHKLVTKIQVPGKEKLVDLKHFDRVPFEIIAPYGITDAVVTRRIGLMQQEEFAALDRNREEGCPSILPLVANERKLTRACFNIERTGMRINRAYTEAALRNEQGEIAKLEAKWQEVTGQAFENSPASLKQAFLAAGVELPLTPTGKPSTKAEVLEEIEHPLGDLLRGIRGRQKLCATYYSSFLYFADHEGFIRANIRQGGTETSRLSYGDPNLQNLPKEDEPEDREKPYIVRRCFIPDDSDWCFVPIDFRQQEFRMMLDYAGETGLIEAINGGVDVHEATAQLCGITRKQAKTINFGLLYGMGVDKLAKDLGMSKPDAQHLKFLYFAKLPRVQRFIRRVMQTGESRGYVWNWAGFRNNIAQRDWAYILPNHVIQGGCAQVLRLAMTELDAVIEKNKLRSRMAAQVHDELLFKVHRTELHWVPEFQRIMEKQYQPRNGMKLTCSVEHSWKSWGKFDQIEGYPSLQELSA